MSDYITECQIAMRLKEDPDAPRCMDCGAPVTFDRYDMEDGADVYRCPRCGPVVEVDFESETRERKLAAVESKNERKVA